MRAWQVHELGAPKSALKLVEVEEPTVGSGEVCIRVEAAALNFFDILLCKGEYQERPELPFTPGGEVSGPVLEAGEGVDLQPGDRVIATPPLPRGGYAEKVVAPVGSVFAIPESIPFESAAALPITYQTSHVALHRRAGLREGETVLVHAGAGGVGSAAIQLARAAGARVFATAGGEEKVEACRRLGAEVAIDYREEDFIKVVKAATEGRGADVIFDPVGGDTFDGSRRGLKIGCETDFPLRFQPRDRVGVELKHCSLSADHQVGACTFDADLLKTLKRFQFSWQIAVDENVRALLVDYGKDSSRGSPSL